MNDEGKVRDEGAYEEPAEPATPVDPGEIDTDIVMKGRGEDGKEVRLAAPERVDPGEIDTVDVTEGGQEEGVE
jgi:hypothetical protein